MMLKAKTTGEIYKYSAVGKIKVPYLQYVSDAYGNVKKSNEPFEVKPDFNKLEIFEKLEQNADSKLF